MFTVAAGEVVGAGVLQAGKGQAKTLTSLRLGILQLTGIRSFALAGERAGLPFKITPHVLRASLITYLRREGFNDGAIQKVTGHASSEMIRSYDKNGLSDNPTAEVSLI